MSITQLKALGPDNTAMVSPAQNAALSPEQATALLETLSGSRAEVNSEQAPITTAPLSGMEDTCTSYTCVFVYTRIYCIFPLWNPHLMVVRSFWCSCYP